MQYVFNTGISLNSKINSGMIFIHLSGVFLATRPSAGHSWQWHIHPDVRHWEIAGASVQASLEPILVDFIGQNYYVVLLEQNQRYNHRTGPKTSAQPP